MVRMMSQQITGPMFRPGMVASFDRAVTREIDLAVADYALWRVKAYNASDFRNPTGHYRSLLHVQRSGLVQVTDSHCVYGPWLEGTGSRNRSSRFKGYHHWRRARQDVERAARRIANQVVARALRRLQ